MNHKNQKRRSLRVDSKTGAEVPTFIEKCLAGMCLNTIDNLDKEIKSWIETSRHSSLQSWLGLTDEEFHLLMSTPKDEQSTCFKEILINRAICK